jgi:hypothetical protein
MRNIMLIPHISVARATIVPSLSQTVILAAFISFAKATRNEGVHAKHDQERRGSEGQLCQDLRTEQNGVKSTVVKDLGLLGCAQTENRSRPCSHGLLNSERTDADE